MITNISYTKPATASADDVWPTAIPNPGAVGFGYDQAGNRLWMTDGQGRTDYQYDTFSRLQFEERYITEMAKSFRLTYSYNLAGQLTSISDPFASAINYAYNSAGALSGVTGGGYGSVTTFASNIQYRAWGALKHINYGDGLGVDYSYNTRLQMGRYNRGGAMTDYTYYNDGRVKDARHLGSGNADFDRSYSYDHVGRMTQGLSGREARGLPPDPNDPTPYRQTYQYDVFSNLTSRTSSMWNHEINPFNGVYLNDRNTSWTYDDAGNLKNDGAGRVTTYDVANRVTKWETVFDTISQKYDGDGRAVKRVETRSDPLFTSTIYYLRSSVMGGLVVAEINAGGKRELGYVYANGMEIGRYRKPSASQGFEVQWSHEEPMTGDRIEGGLSITTDPLGGLVPGSDPFVTPNVEYGDLLGGRESHTADSDPFSLGSGCSLDGVPIDCNVVISLLSNGAAVVKVTSGVNEITLPARVTSGVNENIVSASAIGIGGSWVWSTTDAEATDYDSGSGGGVRLGVSVKNWAWRWVPFGGGFGSSFGFSGIRRVGFQDPSGRPTRRGPCGVNPITGQPGFTPRPGGQPGNLRLGESGGQGGWLARRPANKSGVHSGLDIAGGYSTDSAPTGEALPSWLNNDPLVLSLIPQYGDSAGNIVAGGLIYANRAGKVIASASLGALGNTVIIDHGGGVITGYAHNALNLVRKGDSVTEGQPVGRVGQTGNAKGQSLRELHVHFSVKVKGVYVDPAAYLNNPCP